MLRLSAHVAAVELSDCEARVTEPCRPLDTPKLLVITECYPRPAASHHCAFAHRQMVGLHRAGWSMQVALPNGWYPRVGWQLTDAWRDAHASGIPRDWNLDGIDVGDLTFANG